MGARGPSPSPILPGATIGIFGGGQLGRMTAMAARSFGYRIQVLDPDSACPAAGVADHCISASFQDTDAAATLGRHADVVTIEIEKIAIAGLEAAARFCPARPAPALLEMVQDRVRQKDWLAAAGFPVGAYRAVRSAEELAEATAALGGRVIAKAAFGGYDGRGQCELSSPSEATQAFDELRAPLVVAEQKLDLASEVSVLVARRPSGETVVFPPAQNHHEQRILAWSVTPTAPGFLPPADLARAEEIARGIAAQTGLEGIIAVEFFVTTDGRLLVNELAPRPHNSFHATERACATSQFEQLVRAVCDLPLGSVELLRPAAIANLLGDLWVDSRLPNFAAALAVPGVRLHLYGKTSARPGRKMGHISAIGDSVSDAIERVQRAVVALGER